MIFSRDSAAFLHEARTNEMDGNLNGIRIGNSSSKYMLSCIELSIFNRCTDCDGMIYLPLSESAQILIRELLLFFISF